MNGIADVIGGLDGGSVLDVATQEGHFVQLLMTHLKTYTEIVGIDINAQVVKTAQSTLGQACVRFLVMDAGQLAFEDERFDTVSITASLHHVANIHRVLGEMKRVLKPGGHFLLIEMHRDGHTAAERTSVYLHQWVADVDSALGRLHNHTLARQTFVDYVSSSTMTSTAIQTRWKQHA